jgi:hypothetical protein
MAENKAAKIKETKKEKLNTGQTIFSKSHEGS